MTVAVRSPRRTAPAAFAAALVALAGAALVSPGVSLPGRGGETAPATRAALVHPVEFFDERAFALAVRTVDAEPPRPMPGARALIIPHHWTAGPLIVGPLRDLAATREVRRVILIGPNHTNSGGAAMMTSDRSWSTPFGVMPPDGDALTVLASAGAGVEPDVLTYEHSVAGIVPALRYALPDATIVPLIIKRTATGDEVARIAAALAPLLADEGTVIVASVDFSHGLRREVAEARNAETRAILERMAATELLGLSNEHLDSPASIAVALEAARIAGATGFELRADTTSAEFASGDGTVTSYLVGYVR
jgi:MEMO1 family protein